MILYQNCKSCGEKIPEIRLEIFPDTVFCVKCTNDPPKRFGLMSYSHKTAPELIMTSGEENIRKLQRDFNRER